MLTAAGPIQMSRASVIRFNCGVSRSLSFDSRWIKTLKISTNGLSMGDRLRCPLPCATQTRTIIGDLNRCDSTDPRLASAGRPKPHRETRPSVSNDGYAEMRTCPDRPEAEGD